MTKKKARKRQYVSIPQGEGHYDRVEVKCKARRAVHDGTPPCICEPKKAKKPKTPRPPWPKGPSAIPPPLALCDSEGMPWAHTHEWTGSSGCNACQVEESAPRVGGQAWADYTQELIAKLGFSPRYPGLTDEQHLVELIGPKWAEDAKQKWVVNWTVDGYLARRPHLKAKPREKAPRHPGVLLAGQERPAGKRWSVVVTERGVHFNIDHQGFMLVDNYDPEDGWTKQAYYKWYATQLTIAFKRLMGES
jgi:hypothetical protein